MGQDLGEDENPRNDAATGTAFDQGTNENLKYG